MFVFLDESGSFNKDNDKYFIVGSYTVGDSQRIANAFRRWQRTKFPRKLKVQSEVKFNDSHLDDNLRLRTINFLAKQDVRIFYTYFKVINIPSEYRGKERTIKTGLLYTEIVGETLELYFPSTDQDFRVFRDQRILKGVTLSDFNQHLKTRLLPELSAKTIVQIQAVDSSSSALIQVADWICGALGRFYEKKLYGMEFYKALKNNIVGEKELFPDYWDKKWETGKEKK